MPTTPSPSSRDAVLRARSVTVTRGPATVLSSVDVTIAAGRRIGLIGPNGVGKTTLLATLAGVIRPDSGTVELTPSAATIGYLTQERISVAGETVAGSLARRTGVAGADEALDEVAAALAARHTGADESYAVALDRWLAIGAADYEARRDEAMTALGLPARLLDQPMRTLSGGEAAQINLAALTISRFDVYLLDEPTNDLDLAGLARLERWIDGLGAGCAIVSHDRTFLARTVTEVVELDEFTHEASRFGGGWDAFVAERGLARRHAWERFERYDTQRKALASRAQREREWASQGVAKVKRSDEPDKNIRSFKIDQTEKLAGRAARTQKAMERLDVVDKPREPWQLRMTVADAGRSGDVVARFHAVTVRRGDFTLGPVDLEIAAGERIALLGANGSGKTTLVDVLTGRRTPDRGERWIGPSVVLGEIEQVRGQFGGDVTLGRAFQDATGLGMSEVRTLLAKLGLVADHVTRPTATLSPGERTRAALGLLMAIGCNALVLDEPTNHLDLPAIEELERSLDAFAGTILLITHDRSLLDAVRMSRRLTMQGGRISHDETV